jgi:hypothetical protein
MYFNGDGIIQDNVYPHMRWNIATSNIEADAKMNKGIVTERMTAAQVPEA